MRASDFTLIRDGLIDFLSDAADVPELPSPPIERALALVELRNTLSAIRLAAGDIDAVLSGELTATGVATRACADCGSIFVVSTPTRRPRYCIAHQRER